VRAPGRRPHDFFTSWSQTRNGAGSAGGQIGDRGSGDLRAPPRPRLRPGLIARGATPFPRAARRRARDGLLPGRGRRLHDPLLELSTTLSGWAHRRTAAQIGAGRLRQRDGAPSEEPPLLLDELLELAPPDATLQLEVKAHADPALARRTTRAICDRLAHHPARARTEILSFFTTACELAADLGFRTRLIIIADYGLDALATWAQAAGLHGVCVEHFLLSPALVGTLRAAALSVSTGTVNHPALLARLLPLGLDAITSDTPAELRAALAASDALPLAA